MRRSRIPWWSPGTSSRASPSRRNSTANIPNVVCCSGDINQVFLNLVVNAAHAVADVVDRTGELGRITVTNRREGDNIIVSHLGHRGSHSEIDSTTPLRAVLHDEGGRPGKRTRFALARNVVVDEHGGELTFETEVGVGTTFHIRLPHRTTGEAGPRDTQADVSSWSTTSPESWMRSIDSCAATATASRSTPPTPGRRHWPRWKPRTSTSSSPTCECRRWTARRCSRSPSRRPRRRCASSSPDKRTTRPHCASCPSPTEFLSKPTDPAVLFTQVMRLAATR